MKPTDLPPLSLFHYRLPLQLRFNDVDVLGHVNNTVYFSFYDTGKAGYFSEVLDRKVDWQHVDSVIANVECAYISPIYFNEKIEVLTTCLSISHKSFTILQMLREAVSGEVKSICKTVMVCIDPETKKAVEVSKEWRKKLREFEGRELEVEKE